MAERFTGAVDYGVTIGDPSPPYLCAIAKAVTENGGDTKLSYHIQEITDTVGATVVRAILRERRAHTDDREAARLRALAEQFEHSAAQKRALGKEELAAVIETIRSAGYDWTAAAALELAVNYAAIGQDRERATETSEEQLAEIIRKYAKEVAPVLGEIHSQYIGTIMHDEHDLSDHRRQIVGGLCYSITYKVSHNMELELEFNDVDGVPIKIVTVSLKKTIDDPAEEITTHPQAVRGLIQQNVANSLANSTIRSTEQARWQLRRYDDYSPELIAALHQKELLPDLKRFLGADQQEPNEDTHENQPKNPLGFPEIEEKLINLAYRITQEQREAYFSRDTDDGSDPVILIPKWIPEVVVQHVFNIPDNDPHGLLRYVHRI